MNHPDSGFSLAARHLTKYYAATAAVRDVSFNLTPGSVLGLLGPNGSGKTTIVSLITGLIEPSSGQVCLNGLDVRECSSSYRAILGYVPEEAQLYTYLTGPEFLALVGQLRSMDAGRLQRKIESFLDLFDLTDERYAPMSAYSKGMRQKVLLAASLLHDPQVIIFDEPDSGLDVTSSLVLRSLTRALAAEGRLVLYSSHVLEIVESVSTDVLILHEGRVVGHGSVSDLRRLMQVPTLELVFRKLAVETDIDEAASKIIEVMKA